MEGKSAKRLFKARNCSNLRLLPDLLNLIVYELLGIFPHYKDEKI